MMSPLLSRELSEVAPAHYILSCDPRFATSAGAPAVPRARCLAPFFPPTLLA
jgi:hypothetical protein